MIQASYFVPHKFGAKSGAETRILRTSTGYYTLENMSDGKENADTRHSCEDEQQLEKEIDKEIHKLKYFLDETDELIKLRDYTEMDIANRRAGENCRQVIGSYFASRGIKNRSWCISLISETMEEGRKGQVFHISCGQRKARKVLK